MALRFTQRDFLGLREEMVRFMQEKLGDKWNDYSESDETITLIELLAHCVSNLHFAYDNQKRETDIVTASFPRNVYAHAIRNGYKPSIFKAGTTWLNIDLRKKVDNKVTDEFTTLPVSVLIPRYTQIKNTEGDICITNRDFVLPAGTAHFSIEVLGGEYAFEQFTKSDINDFNYIVLNRLNTAYGTTRLFYQKEEWTPVVDVFTDPRTNKIYSLEPNFVQNGVRNIIRFFSTWPNDITDNSTIIIEYIQTFGANSNYEKDTFTSYLDLNKLDVNTVSFDDDIFDSSGNNIKTWTDVEFSFTQPKAFTGGQNFEAIDVIKKSYIQSIRQTTSLVVLNDYYAYLTLNGINEFYVTDWNKNSSDLITVDYPRDIKAIKAEKDEEGHSIYSKQNNYPISYWPNDVEYINSVDKITETRKISGREIIIFKSFDVNINDYAQYENEHWYEEWKKATKIKQEISSYPTPRPVIYLASPDRIDDWFVGNYDNAVSFIDSQSRILREIKDKISSEEKEKKIRLFVYNESENKIVCSKFEDLIALSQLQYKSSETYCSKVFKSYFKANEITCLLFDHPPIFFEEIDLVQTNVADVMFDDKNEIYINEFKEELESIYGDQYNEIISNEESIKNSLGNKISSIGIKIEGFDTPFYVPQNLWYDTFSIIDGSSKTESEDNTYNYKHNVFKDPEEIYKTTGYFNSEYIDDYIIDIHENDKNGLPILNLYSSKQNKQDAIDSGDLDYTYPEKLHSNISLCFRKKTIDLPTNKNFCSDESSILEQTTNSVYYVQGSTETYIQFNETVVSDSLSTTYTITCIPIITALQSSSYESTSFYKLKELQPNFFIKNGITSDNYDNEKNAYRVISTVQNEAPLVIADDCFYHDDFIFDETQLTVKQLNLHYQTELLTQNNIGNLTKDDCDLVYVEEHCVSKCNEYELTFDSEHHVTGINIPDQSTAQYLNTKFGFLRTATSITGSNKYDYCAVQNEALNGNEPLTDIEKKNDYIKNSFLLDVQISYPKYLKYLILRICNYYNASYTASHAKLNKMLVELGVDNILFALTKILNAEFSITYWFSDEDATLGKQYAYSPNENKRFLCCGGLTSWDEETSPSKNYFRWNVVFPEIVELYQSIQQKQGRGDSVYILPYTKNGIDVHAHIYIDESTSDVSSVFENIWNALIDWFGLLKNIEEVKYLSELVSIIQSSDSNILKVCTVNETPYNGVYSLQQLNDNETIYRTDVSESSIKDFFKFLKFYPTTDIQPKTNLGQSLVLGTVCIRLQKMSTIEKTVYHFERSCFKIETTLAYKLKQVN